MSRSPGSTFVPEVTASRSMVPSAGALIALSIFIASIVPICSPSSTLCPSSTSLVRFGHGFEPDVEPHSAFEVHRDLFAGIEPVEKRFGRDDRDVAVALIGFLLLPGRSGQHQPAQGRPTVLITQRRPVRLGELHTR